MAATRIFLCHDLDPASQIGTSILTPLLARLQERDFDVIQYPGSPGDEHFLAFVDHYVTTCQWFLLLQTPGLAALSPVQEAVNRALDLAAQKHLQGVLRLTTMPPAGEDAEHAGQWAALPTFDGTYDPLRAIERLLLALPSSEATEELAPRGPGLRAPEQAGAATYDRPTRPARRLVKFRGTVRYRFQDVMYSHRRAVITTSILVLLALLGSTTLLLVQHLAPAPLPVKTSSPVYGQATFFSTNLAGTEMNSGVADGIHISLQHLPSPAANHSYYAWLLPDSANPEAPLVLAGQFEPTNGSASITYIDPNSSNILITKSRILITEENTTPAPALPTPEVSKWRFYGILPQIPNQQDANHFSALDHLRHLLSDDSMNAMVPMPGGLGVWTLQNVRRVFEWSSNAWGPGNPKKVGATTVRNDLIAILDTLDGEEAVQQDLPQNTPLLVDQAIARKPLLSLNATARVPGYLVELNSHVFGFASAPGTSVAEQQMAAQITVELGDLQTTLEQVRQDAKELEAQNDQNMLSASALQTFADLINQAQIAYSGQVDATTDARVGGILLIYAQLQQLTAFPIVKYTDQLQV